MPLFAQTTGPPSTPRDHDESQRRPHRSDGPNARGRTGHWKSDLRQHPTLAPRHLTVHHQDVYPFERFSTEAKQVLTLAQEEAERGRHSYIGTEHVLLGVLRTKYAIGMRLLAELDIDLKKVRSQLATKRSREHAVVRDAIPTSRVKKVIELAFEEARKTGFNDVTSGHIVVGLLLEGEGTAAAVLKDLGAELDDVRKLLSTLTAAGFDETDVPVATDVEAAQQILDLAQQDAVQMNSSVVDSDNVLRVLVTEDSFTTRILRRQGVDTARLRGALTPPADARRPSESIRQVRDERDRATAAQEYTEAAAKGRREKELISELDDRLRRWRETLE